MFKKTSWKYLKANKNPGITESQSRRCLESSELSPELKAAFALGTLANLGGLREKLQNQIVVLVTLKKDWKNKIPGPVKSDKYGNPSTLRWEPEGVQPQEWARNTPTVTGLQDYVNSKQGDRTLK